MSFRPFSSLLPDPKHSADTTSSVSFKQSGGSIKDTIILDQLRPQNAPVASISDFVPLRQRDLSLEIPLPTAADIKQTFTKTKAFLDSLLAKKSTITSGPNANTTQSKTEAMASGQSGVLRPVKVIEHKKDPLQPVTHRKRKVVAPSEEIQAPILHKSDDTSTKPTKEELDKWKIPSAISNWKNPNGFAISLDNRATIESNPLDNSGDNKKDGFLLLAEALDEADREARERIKVKQEVQKDLEEKDSLRKEQRLRDLAERAHEDREQRRQYENEAHYTRDLERNKRRRTQDEINRVNKVSTAEKLRRLAYQQGRDISDKVVLNAAKATETPDVQYDSRLFSKGSSSVSSSANQIYDSPLFNDSQIGRIYRPAASANEETDEIISRISNKRGRMGPVEFGTADDGRNPDEKEELREESQQYGLQVKRPHTS
ncbi:unnamed protein product [Kluyveromyces dobzhanskii CBS 2104]|uniref:Pre-mRNA-processing protein 45 n=1 Tax=Kluyveromyces dobzhanskii CBS 2104 TaxID=1427455 RepID=A0A0A8LAR2_9SACH|nr:unnamed protein product [Kluyveromyces dobzhanskii CBS 2104]